MRLLLSILIAFCILSCRKNNQEPDLPKAVNYSTTTCIRTTNNLDTVQQMIVGTYDWAYTFYQVWRQPAEIWTPQNKRLTYRYIFRPNSEVEYYENSKLIWTNNYIVDYEFKVSAYPLDSLTMVIINDKITGQRKEYFRAYLCNDSASFYNPYSSVDVIRHFKRR
jgi:hypothetical protein